MEALNKSSFCAKTTLNQRFLKILFRRFNQVFVGNIGHYFLRRRGYVSVVPIHDADDPSCLLTHFIGRTHRQNRLRTDSPPESQFRTEAVLKHIDIHTLRLYGIQNIESHCTEVWDNRIDLSAGVNKHILFHRMYQIILPLFTALYQLTSYGR